MKNLFLALLFSSISMFTQAQTQEDKQNVIQQCIDINDLQSYYHPTTIDGKQVLVILENDETEPLKLQQYGSPVKHYDMESLFAFNYKAFLKFKKITIRGNRAEVLMSYDIENVKVSVYFEKLEDKWQKKKHTIMKQ